MADRIGLPTVNMPLLPDEPSRGVENKVTTIIAQMLAGGTATPGEIQLDIDLNTEDTLFGAGSDAAEMVRNFRIADQVSELNVIGVSDDGGATAASIPVVFLGTATAAGTYDVYVGSKETVHRARVAVQINDDETAIGDTLEAALNALTKAPSTGANAVGTVTITAKNKGPVGDNIGILIEGTVAGVGVTIGSLTPGATAPTLTGIDAQLGFQTDIVMPYELEIGDLQTFLDGRFNIVNDTLNGVLFTAITDAKAAIVAIGDLENSQSTVIWADKPVSITAKVGNALFEQAQNIAAIAAGTRALRLEDGADISSIITSREPLDNIGGVHTASLPYFNTLTALEPIPVNQGWSQAEVADLNDAGISVIGNNDARNAIILGAVLTTYKTNIQGLDDPTWKYLNYVDTATASREFMFKSVKADYAQARLQIGNRKITGYKIATEQGIIADFMSYYSALSSAPYVLLQGGEIAGSGETIADVFRDNLTVSIDTTAGSFTVTGILPIMSQTRRIDAPFSIKLDVRK